MALLNCPECGKKFSSLAEMCPECGCPTFVAESWKDRLPVSESGMASPASFGNQTSSASTSSTPRSSTRDLELGNGVTMRFASIPAGRFLMGSPRGELGRLDEEQHEVTISKSFYMGIHQVTQAQYNAVMGTNPSFFKGGDLPVENVSWEDAVEFCRKLSEKTGRNVRLPTEAEWEYACRAGTTTPFNTGATISTDQANYNGNDIYGGGRKGKDRHRAMIVGAFPANSFGLYDMHGNVFEWCSDRSGDYPKKAVTDPQGASLTESLLIGDFRVVRGGSWFYGPMYCRSAYRNGHGPDSRHNDLGFRVSLD